MSGGGSSSTDPYYEKAPSKKQLKQPLGPSELSSQPIDNKDTPKKKKKQPIDPSELPVTPIGPVKVIPMPKRGKSPITGFGRSRVLWYKCDNCGELFLSGHKGSPHGIHGFCKPKCESDWRSKYQKGRPHSEDHRRKIGESKVGKPRSDETKKKVSDARKELYKDPKFRERMKKAANRPEVREKQAESKRGSRNPNWKGGPSERKNVPTPAEQYRESWEWRNKSEEIRERDGHTCTNCGQKFEKGDGMLDVHHTYPLNDWIDKGYNPSDYPDSWLMTLDKSCHTKAENQPGIFKLPPKE